ncbi:hypothetical protein [Klebsiella pneumoniae]|uniref:hypothetical protein n=1 Tax=Klebsiella pneumoniae TaxID=573 RepID=UPI001ABCFBD6|nr:hypothetical protein [Klebsiella pneumoniae]HCA9839057.1 hypothetical protein [Klebsiella variicola subsp. variicola]MCP2565398.1 holin family protein [Klebsiella pneumoniae]MCQ0997642.1 holin family protein [Klebsiella pneumoniae]MCQ1002390.1 holin family protein [Klebsiella pneumoniae]HCB0057398.1 hypothetical protein [Klebsiella pneumoniae]
MISAIIELVKTGFSFFQKKQEKEVNVELEKNKEANETNREEIKKGFSWRNALGYVCVFVIAYSYILIPIADYFGIALIQMPLSDIIRIIILLISGS